MRQALASSALGLVVLGLVTGCGGGSDSSSGAAKRTITPGAQAQAKTINLRLSDFPDGWRASTRDEDTAGQSKFRKCIGADYSDITFIGDASSKDFAKSEGTEASSNVQIAETGAQAIDATRRLATAMGGRGTKDCVRDLFEITPGYKVGEIDVGELSFTPAASVDDGQAWEIVIPIEITSGPTKGLSASAYIDLVQLQKGNILGNITTVDVLSPLDETLRADLVRTVGRRMSSSA